MNDEQYMRRAIEIAEKGRGFTRTNPLVGCVIVKDGRVIGEGYHEKFGEQHAEVNALSRLKESADGATLYVNLEPCCHVGKQPPCVESIAKHRIRRVVISNVDPDERVAGGGIRYLKECGMKVTVGVLEEEGRQLNEIFFFHKRHHRPFITLKYAMTMDGKIATVTGDSRWISNETSRRFVHVLRHRYDAILVGKNTVIQDDPKLTCRIENGRDPVRVVLDSRASLPTTSHVFSKGKERTILLTTVPTDRQYPFTETVSVKAKNGRVDLSDAMRALYEKDIASVLVEGGSQVNFSFLEQALADRVYVFLAPMFLGGSKAKTAVGGKGFENIADAYRMNITKVEQMGDDWMVRLDRVYGNY